jgi:hypothetical protein
MQPMPKRVGSSEVKTRSSMERRGVEAGFFEGAHGFEAAEDADGAVVHAGVGDGVGVGAGADGGEGGVGAGEADEGVADGVGADAEACGGGEGGDVGAGFEVAGGEDDAGDGGGVGVGGGWAVGEGGEVVELVEEAGGVDGWVGHGSLQFVIRDCPLELRKRFCSSKIMSEGRDRKTPLQHVSVQRN